MKVKELGNNKYFIEAEGHRILTDGEIYFDTIITSVDRVPMIKEIDRHSEYWGMSIEKLFSEEDFETQKNELGRILNQMQDAIDRVQVVMDELLEMSERREK